MDEHRYEAVTRASADGSSRRHRVKRPVARRDHLLMQQVGDELVIYDQARHQAHQLNRTAALIWRHADGQSSEADLSQMLERELGRQVDHDALALGLEQLANAHLLEEPAQWLTRSMSRRRVLVKLGVAGSLGLLAPAVKSIVAPDAAMAQYGDGQCDQEQGVLERMRSTAPDAECDEQGILERNWWQ